MGQKVNPIANRLGIIRGWDSNWYGGKDFSSKLVEDAKIRKYLSARLAKASISKIIIERTLKLVTVTISTARPGIIIGKGGQEVDKLKEELRKLTGKEVQINIFEVKRPEIDAVIVGNNIAPARRPHFVSPRRQDGHRIDDAHGRRGHQDSDLGPRRRSRNGPQRDV